jgi:hypothetical protein
MKKLIPFLIIIAIVSCNNANNTTKKPMFPSSLVNNPHTINGADTAKLNSLATMDFSDTVYDFGTIHEGESVTHDFSFKNNGRSPLVISAAEGSCGCTVPQYPRVPINPGQGEMVKVIFNSKGKSGHQEKSVTISTNSRRGTHMLFIKGEVTESKK